MLRAHALPARGKLLECESLTDSQTLAVQSVSAHTCAPSLREAIPGICSVLTGTHSQSARTPVPEAMREFGVSTQTHTHMRPQSPRGYALSPDAHSRRAHTPVPKAMRAHTWSQSPCGYALSSDAHSRPARTHLRVPEAMRANTCSQSGPEAMRAHTSIPEAMRAHTCS